MGAAATILNQQGPRAVEIVQRAVISVSATNKTRNSVGYQVISDSTSDTLILWARDFFSLLESGRGPRKSSVQGDFKENMEEWMVARNIGAGLSVKKRAQLARFLTLQINKYGDKTYQAGGRQVYSDALNKFVEELADLLTEELGNNYLTEITK